MISWLGTVETNQDLIIFSQIYDRLFRLRADAMITSVHGGVNVLLDVNRNHLTSFEFSKFFNQECFTLQRSGSAFMGRYRSAIDILRIAVIPDRRFLRWTCSLCLFSSACPNVSVDLQPGDSPVVPLPSPCARVLGQVALAPSLIRQSACLLQTALAHTRYSFHVFQRRCRSGCEPWHYVWHSHTRIRSSAASFSAFMTVLTDQFVRDLIPPISISAALSESLRSPSGGKSIVSIQFIRLNICMFVYGRTSVNWCSSQANQFSSSFPLGSRHVFH